MVKEKNRYAAFRKIKFKTQLGRNVFFTAFGLIKVAF